MREGEGERGEREREGERGREMESRSSRPPNQCVLRAWWVQGFVLDPVCTGNVFLPTFLNSPAT